MKQKHLFLFAAVLLGIGTVKAKKIQEPNSGQAFIYVQQNGVKIDQLGTAVFTLSATSFPTVEFDENGKAVMKIGENTVAVLPMNDNGQLVVEFESTVAEESLNKVTKTFSNEYATLYSPFQLTVPESSAVEVYAPTYDEANQLVKCNSTTQIASNDVIPIETALLLKRSSSTIGSETPASIDFEITADAATDTHESALSGSSLLIDVPTTEVGNTVYTLGHKDGETTKYGFFEYSGSKLNPGLAWLKTVSMPPEAKFFSISFDEDETTGVSEFCEDSLKVREWKFIENGHVVIVKRLARTDDGQSNNIRKYNLNGQEVK